MNFDQFIKEINSIENPSNREGFLALVVDQKLRNLEREYEDRSAEYLRNLRIEIKSKDLKLLAKSLALLAKNQSRLIMILDKLVEEISQIRRD